MAAGLIAAGLVSGRASAGSAEPTVQQFLLAWEDGHYATAAGYTTGSGRAVAGALQTAFNQLDAAKLALSMGSIRQRGDTATAWFHASVDLVEAGAPWDYQGHLVLHATGSAWKIRWSPAVINPHLRQGMTLAVRTTLAPRAQVLDASGRPLEQSLATYVLGVRPGALADPPVTATAFARLTGLDAGEVLDRIRAAPPGSFFGLLTLDPASYARLRPRLASVPGLAVRMLRQRLFASIASDVVGSVGAENAAAFRQNGVAYQPGDTIGLSGLQQYYQHRLVGSPQTEVIAEDARGHVVELLKKWPGASGLPVRTTLSTGVQMAANQALRVAGGAAAIVAVRASSGQILAVAGTGPAHGVPAPDPLDGRYPPGEAFTIVSTTALLGTGLSVQAAVPCTPVSDVGGQTFTDGRASRGLGAQPLFSADFAAGCRTAFAGLSRRLTPSDLSRAAAEFGFGSAWRLPLASFSGSLPAAQSDAELAAETIGAGGVRVSPLEMALIAARVDAGGWRAPSLVSVPAGPGDPLASQRDAAAGQVTGVLQALMRAAVRTGAAQPTGLGGLPVYGQVGSAQWPQGGKGVQASWFVGFRGNVAFAVLSLGRPAGGYPLSVAAQFLRLLPASALGQQPG